MKSLIKSTKGICGHNDATLGILAGERDLIDDVWRYSVLHGAVPSPHDALNSLRGLRTLPVRIERQSATAAALAEFLVGRPEVQAVHCTGLASHPQKALVDRQMRLGGSMLSFELADATAARRFLEHVQLARLATSLGGPETLVTAPALTTHAGLGPDELMEAGITSGMVRVSVGLEHVDDLVADFDKALNA